MLTLVSLRNNTLFFQYTESLITVPVVVVASQIVIELINRDGECRSETNEDYVDAS